MGLHIEQDFHPQHSGGFKIKIDGIRGTNTAKNKDELFLAIEHYFIRHTDMIHCPLCEGYIKMED